MSLWGAGDAQPGFGAVPASLSSHITGLRGECHDSPPALFPGMHVLPKTEVGGDVGAGPGSQVMAAAHTGPDVALAALLML